MTTLYEETVRLLKNRPVTLKFEMIAKEVGVSEAWLTKLNNDKLKNPSYFRIEELNTFLKGYNVK